MVRAFVAREAKESKCSLVGGVFYKGIVLKMKDVLGFEIFVSQLSFAVGSLG